MSADGKRTPLGRTTTLVSHPTQDVSAIKVVTQLSVDTSQNISNFKGQQVLQQ